MSKPVQKMVLRIGQLEGPYTSLEPPEERPNVVWRTVAGMFGGVPLCARHGFYNRDYEEEHKQRQRIIREARCGVKSKQGLTCGMKKGHKGKKHNALAWAVYPPPDGPLR